MKISTRLSFYFSALTSLVLIIVGVVIVWLASTHRESVFNERLNNRLNTTENIFLEQERFTDLEIERIKNQFSVTLPNEEENVVAFTPNNISQALKRYPEEAWKEALPNQPHFFYFANKQGVSKIIKAEDRTYLVLVMATDTTGLANLAYLKSRLVLMMILVLPFIFLSSIYLTKTALKPLQDKINHANAIGATNLYQRLQVYNPNDEIGQMAVAFNKMLDRIEHSMETQKAFIANASHEIRNPLTAIIGEADVALTKSRSKEEYVETLQQIVIEAENLNGTVSNLLQLSKISTNPSQVQFIVLELNAFIKEAFQSFNVVNPNNKIQIELPKKTVFSSINSNLFKTVLYNLWDNAIKFSGNDVVVTRLTIVDSRAEVSITDAGIGIATEELAKIANPFFRGSNTIKIKGSGIGLALTSKILVLHQSSLQVQSEPGQGTRVWFSLPTVD